MNDEMTADLKDAKAFHENAAIASFDEIVAAKTKQIDALTASIESKTALSSDLAVKNAEMMHDLDDTREQTRAAQVRAAQVVKQLSIDMETLPMLQQAEKLEDHE